MEPIGQILQHRSAAGQYVASFAGVIEVHIQYTKRHQPWSQRNRDRRCGDMMCCCERLADDYHILARRDLPEYLPRWSSGQERVPAMISGYARFHAGEVAGRPLNPILYPRKESTASTSGT